MRAERQHLAVSHVHHREGALARAAGERLLAHPLHVEVEREAQLLALLGLDVVEALDQVAEGVHAHLGGAVAPAQEAVVRGLDAGLAHAVAERHVGVAGIVELLLGHLADVAEQVGADLAVRVFAQEDRLDVHAAEVLAALPDVHHGCRGSRPA